MPYLQENHYNSENDKIANKLPIKPSKNDCKERPLLPVYMRDPYHRFQQWKIM